MKIWRTAGTGRFGGFVELSNLCRIVSFTATRKRRNIPTPFLRFKEDADGNIEVTADGSGEPLTLSTSTVTLGELASWMSGFNERRQKQDEEFRVNTLIQWLNFKINTYLEQADKADKEK